jgi:hypothetical protein
MLFTPSRLLIVCVFEEDSFAVAQASSSGAGSVYTHIDVSDGDSTCHFVRLELAFEEV